MKVISSISFVVNSVDDARFAIFERQLRRALDTEELDIIRISDARSMSEGLNRGAQLARGEWLIFCHDDICILSKNSMSVLMDATTKTDMFGPCGTIRLTSGNWYDAGRPFTFGHVVARDLHRPGKYELQLFGIPQQSIQIGGQALDGLWIGCHRRLFDALRGFDEASYKGFVGYDIDFSFRAALAGARVGITSNLTLFHDLHVGEFSRGKLADWETAQVQFQQHFGRYLNTEAGERTHTTIPLENQFELLDVLTSRRHEMRSVDRTSLRRRWRLLSYSAFFQRR